MKRICIISALLFLVFASCGPTRRTSSQQSSTSVTGISLTDTLWTISQTHPEGFTLNVSTLEEQKEGIAVAYSATQGQHDRTGLEYVVSHAQSHGGYVGGWLDSDTGYYYFDSVRLFPEDSLAQAKEFGQENGQIAIYVLSSGQEIRLANDKTADPLEDNSDFVIVTDAVPDVIMEIRYYSTYNFVGDRIDGYLEPTAMLTKEAAKALKAVSDDVIAQGYRLKVFDAYRPQKAVDNFVRWAADLQDSRMKAYFYPDLDKSVLFEQEYIMEKSGHTRGSTVDLTLFDMETEKEVDMGGTFDWFGPESHPDFCGNPDTGEYTGDNSKSPAGRSITPEQFANRMILRRAMLAHGFKPIDSEWWHFTLRDEPFPDTYFTFPITQP